MNALRSALHLLWMALTVIPWATVVVLIAPFTSKPVVYRVCRAWLGLTMHAGGWIMGIHNRVSGMQNLPTGATDGAVLLVKHQSAWETFCMPPLMPHPLAYVFKRELLRIPFFGWAIGRMDMIHIDREHRTEALRKVTEQGRRLLGQGVWVIMFPEGTRIPRGEKGTYQSSGARLAIDCGVPVIPIAVTSARCWPRKAFVKRPGIVDIAIGPAIATAGRKAHEVTREAEAWIEAEMRRLDPEAYPHAETPRSAVRPGA
ncbi:MAG: 1-acyl-sn-glycerol-3-phosphate acyltransferase [Burkholderiales bacterium]|nr:1-acyl-sn-glycerol-3-phosphate acyltransferase [Burkholderiales bacterium]